MLSKDQLESSNVKIGCIKVRLIPHEKMKKQSENKFWEEKNKTILKYQNSISENTFRIFHKLSEFIFEVLLTLKCKVARIP